MSILACRVASNIHAHRAHHLFGNPVGEALTETLFRLPLPADRNRPPDVAFVSATTIAQAPSQPGSDNAWAVLPELMVEVISPNDIAEEVMERLESKEKRSRGIRGSWHILSFNDYHCTRKRAASVAHPSPFFRFPRICLFSLIR